jgi:beta-galactosidase beta subunit
LKNYLSFFVLLFSTIIYSNSENKSVTQDSLKLEQYKVHINTLQYISRQNYNNEFFLDIALQYIDSIYQIENDNNYAIDIEKSILLTKNTIVNNVISKIEFFEFYSGMPHYFGFVDDAIEYAYDDALSQLLNTRYKVLGNVPLSDANITSILVREDCDNETFEIVNQSLISNTNHRIIQSNELIQILGIEKSKNLINGLIIEDDLNKVLEDLNLDRLGLFTVGNIDIINDKIWLVNTDFKTYEKSLGFLESIFTRGYTIDKRDLPLLFELFLVLILAILFVSLAYGFSLIFINRKNIFISTINSNKELLLSVINKVKYVVFYFLIPMILSFTMIYVCSFIIPSSDVDVGEVNVVAWLLSLTILMSFLPVIINLFIVNRLDIDGFHTPLGYTFFF